jgi:hypothetical protein
LLGQTVSLPSVSLPASTSEHAPSTHFFFPHHLSTTTHVTTSVIDHGARTGGVSSDSALPLVGSHRAKPPVAAPIRVLASRCTRLPTLHASLLRSLTTMLVPAECLRTVPCPLWDHTGPSRRSQHLYGSLLAAAHVFPSTRPCLPQLCHWPRPYSGTTLLLRRRPADHNR